MYEVVFEYTIAWWPLAVLAAGLLVAFLVGVAARKPWARSSAWVIGILLSMLIFRQVLSDWNEYSLVEHGFADGRIHVVEGVVDQFVPEPFEGHRDESFVVDTVRFTYSQYVDRGGFHNSSSHGGPIQEDLPVRIHYIPSTPYPRILKVEVKR
jgi:hypothetical protein